MPVRFMGRYPVFGKIKRTGKGTGAIKDTEKGVAYTKSPYFYWWKALTLSEAYKATCESQGQVGNAKLRKVYADFGDVFATGFEKWWRTHGFELFAEPYSPDAVKSIKASEISEYADSVDAGQTLLIAIPLSLSKRDIASAVRKLIAKKHDGKRGRSKEVDRIVNSKARYKLRHFKSIEGLRWSLEVVVGRRAGKMLKQLGRGGKYYDDDTSVSRSNRLGNTIIKGVEQGVFPLTIGKKS